MARKPKVNPEHEKLIEVLKFTPRTYKIQLWGYGGEVVLGEINRKVYDYFREHRIDVSDWATDSDYGESLGVPEDCQPFYSGEWHECDNLCHVWGVSKNSGTLQIMDEQDQVIYERELDSLDGSDVMLSTNDEAWIEMKGPGSAVFYNYSSEKGTFFEGTIELKAPFDPEKLLISVVDIEGDELVDHIEYDGETLDNFGGDTTGKGYDFAMYLVKENNEVEKYADGSDVDEDFDDGTPPMGMSPSDWEKTPKMIGVNPVYTGWYSVHWNGNTWGTLYWNNEKNTWEEYYHGRVTSTYATVDYWVGYNWDTSDWSNRPPEPPDVICKNKECKHVGHSDQMTRNDDYDLICPDCGKTKFDWIDYDPNEKKGLKNREKYMVSTLDAALNKLAEEIPGFPTAADIEELERDVEYELNPWKKSGDETTTNEEKTLTYWTIRPLHKKSIEEVEHFTKDGMEIVHRTGWRWGEWTVATNDGNPPEFEFVDGQLDVNSCYSNNIEEVELVETSDGCWDDMEWPDDIDADERTKIEEAMEEDGYYTALEENDWWSSDTEMYISGPIEISDSDGNVVKTVNE